MEAQQATDARTDSDHFDVSAVRHVVDDLGAECQTHLVMDGSRFALCGSGAGGLRHFGDAAETPTEAAQLGAWVNIREDLCAGCREAFNDAVWQTVEADQ